MDPALETSPGPQLLALEERYRRLLIEQFERLTFKGISRSGKAVSLPLEDVYVDLKAVADVPDAADAYSADERRLLLEAEVRGMAEGDLRRQLDTLRVERWREESRRGGTRLSRRSIAEAVADPGRPGLVILGDPGSGKTTLLHYLALRAAKESAPRARLPIFVPLAAYDDWLHRDHEPLSLGDFLAVYYAKWCSLSGLGPLFQRALDEGRALVLLDGLDEALDVTRRRHIAGQARSLIQSEAGRGNRFVVTSRIVGYREAPLPGDLPHVTVLDFGEPEISAFAHRWCETCEVWFAGGERTDEALRLAAKEEKELLADVRANPSVLRLAANPLLLTMLALLKRQGGRLPEERVRLYERYVDALLDNWEVARSEGARTRAASRFDRNLATSYLIDLALWLQRFKPSGTAQGRDLELALVEIALRADGLDPVKASAKDRQEAREKAGLFLKDMRHFAGLLAERGQDAFGFLHLTFQEYFVGRALARMEPEERWAVLKENLHRSRWLEPILLCAGQLGIVERRSKAVSELGRRVLGAGSPHEELLHRDVLLVAAMAADGVGFERGLLDELAGRLERLADGGVRALRVEALRRLGQMARFSHEGAERWLEERIRQKVDPWEIAQALPEVLGAESCARLRRAIYEWLDPPDSPIAHNGVEALKIAAHTDPDVVGLLLAKFDKLQPIGQTRALEVLADLALTDVSIRRIIIAKFDSTAAYNLQGSMFLVLRHLVRLDEEIRRLVLRKMNSSGWWDVVESTLHVLGAMAATDEEVRAGIIAKLNNSSGRIVEGAIGALGPIASSDGEARRLILTRFGDPDERIRAEAVKALGTLVPLDEEVRSYVLAALDDPVMSVVQAAVGVLAVIAVSDGEVRSLVLRKMKNIPSNARYLMSNALKPLMSVEPEARRFVLQGLDNKDRPVLPHMFDALRGIVPRDEEVFRRILPRLGDPEVWTRMAAIDVLAPLAPSNREVRRHISIKLDDPHSRVCEAAVIALKTSISDDEEVRRLILARLDDPDKGVRAAAVRVMAAMVPDGGEIRRLVLAKLDDPDENVRGAAVRAMAAMVPGDGEIRRLVLAKIDDAGDDMRRSVIHAMAAMAPRDGETRRLILALLGARNDRVREAAVRAIAAMAPTDDEIRRLIIARFDDPSSRVRMEAVTAMTAMVQDDAQVRGLILATLDDPADMMRAHTIGELAKIASNDGEIRRLILARLDDRYVAVRVEAINALGALVSSDDEVCRTIRARLDDAEFSVRCSAVGVMAAQIIKDREAARRTLKWLGVVDHSRYITTTTRRRLADAYAPLLERDPGLFTQVRSMLESPAWPERQGAAWAIIAMPGGTPPAVMPALRGLLDDLRAEESWPERLETASILINDRDPAISRHAIATAVEGLDYATEPWYNLPATAPAVRAKAVAVLGALEPVYRSDEVFARLMRVLEQDKSIEVRDAAYQALLRLAVVPEAEHDIEVVLNNPSSPEQRTTVPTSPAPTKSPLPLSFVLHLSDLHFGTPEDAATWSSQIAEDLHTDLSCPRLDAIILSGDITNRATPEEYAAALTFLQTLRAEFHLTPAQIILVPGNHDLSWDLSEDAYHLHRRSKLKAPPLEGTFIERDGGLLEVRDDTLYPARFEPFATFYQAIRGEPYPLDPAQQAILYPLPAQRLLILGLNSAWDLDHHFRARASIHTQALSRAIDLLRAEPSYKNFLKIAVFHHPVQSPFEDRIKDHGFLERLASADFRLGLHGHIHKAQTNLYRYDMSAAGRRLELLSAGTFGAPTQELVPGYPFQYQLLRFEGETLTVETRRREEINGAWKPDARWTAQRGKDPEPRYRVQL